jgi:hypothetical protein
MLTCMCSGDDTPLKSLCKHTAWPHCMCSTHTLWDQSTHHKQMATPATTCLARVSHKSHQLAHTTQGSHYHDTAAAKSSSPASISHHGRLVKLQRSNNSRATTMERLQNKACQQHNHRPTYQLQALKHTGCGQTCPQNQTYQPQHNTNTQPQPRQHTHQQQRRRVQTKASNLDSGSGVAACLGAHTCPTPELQGRASTALVRASSRHTTPQSHHMPAATHIIKLPTSCHKL